MLTITRIPDRDMPHGVDEMEASDLVLVKKRPQEIRFLAAPSNAVCLAALNRNRMAIEAIHSPSLITLAHASNKAPGMALQDAPIPHTGTTGRRSKAPSASSHQRS